MALNIVACIKQTPATTSIQIDPSTGQILSEGATYAISPFDEYALEEGIRLKEKITGSWVAVLTMGPPRAEEILREAIARGADSVYHLCDAAFENSDTYATSYILSKAIRKIQQDKGKIDLVICAKQTNDSDSGQVGPGLAGWLDWPNVSFVKKIAEITDKKIGVERMMEDGTDALEMELPALICVVKEINEPRLPSLKGKMAAKKTAIAKWTAADIGADAAKIGQQGSPTAVIERASPPRRSGGTRIEGGTLEEKAKKFVDKLKELKLL
ncbi:MAG: electron transfer flavoprotein subunit beta/FixA family protein [Elusimicrobia bacterium]|nr:electron transfer flavoprotein subunit beta/FixA family protein [Elusimicrobiota bacterium]